MESSRNGTRLDQIQPSKVEEMFYPPQNLRKEDVPMPDYQKYYDRLMGKGSKVKWICTSSGSSTKKITQTDTNKHSFTNIFVDLSKKITVAEMPYMPVEHLPGEKLYIDWVGNHPELLFDTHRRSKRSPYFYNYAWCQQHGICRSLSGWAASQFHPRHRRCSPVLWRSSEISRSRQL